MYIEIPLPSIILFSGYIKHYSGASEIKKGGVKIIFISVILCYNVELGGGSKS
jgi:hypothetical protein